MSGLELFGVIFVGGLVGWIASLVRGQRRDLAIHVIIGLVGSFGGALAAHRLDAHILPGMASSLLMSTVGAILAMAIFSLFRRRA
jgi:uncharacterized membrane protein YeaQ/YmgE (transglycosylase-associated protein family)